MVKYLIDVLSEKDGNTVASILDIISPERDEIPFSYMKDLESRKNCSG